MDKIRQKAKQDMLTMEQMSHDEIKTSLAKIETTPCSKKSSTPSSYR